LLLSIGELVSCIGRYGSIERLINSKAYTKQALLGGQWSTMVVNELAQQLSSKDPEKRRVSAETLADFALTDASLLRGSGVIDMLAEKLVNDEYYRVRTAIADTLKYLSFFDPSQLKESHAVESLVEALKNDEMGVVRRRAAEALANLALKDPSQLVSGEGINVIVGALQKDEEDSVRIGAVRALQHLVNNAPHQLKGTCAFEALMNALERDSNTVVSSSASEVLSNMVTSQRDLFIEGLSKLLDSNENFARIVCEKKGWSHLLPLARKCKC